MAGIKRLLNHGIFWYLFFFPITKAGFFLICIKAFYLPKVNSPFIHFSFRTDSNVSFSKPLLTPMMTIQRNLKKKNIIYVTKKQRCIHDFLPIKSEATL